MSSIPPLNPDATILQSVAQGAVDTVGDVLTGVPAPVRKNLLKALNRLCTAAVEIPAAMMEGVVNEKRAESEARVRLIQASSNQIAQQMSVDPEYARVAARKFGQRVIREQVNLDQISMVAAEELKASKPPPGDAEPDPIEDDWLHQFEKEACQRSDADIQKAFSKILAGEILKPGSFSVRAIRTLAQLDKSTANLLRQFCGICIAMRDRATNEIWDARIPLLGRDPDNNGLIDFGFSFNSLNLMEEAGLILSTHHTERDYSICVAEDNRVKIPFWYAGAWFAFHGKPGTSVPKPYKLEGVALTRTGRELMKALPFVPNDAFSTAIKDYFTSKDMFITSVKFDD